MPLMPTIPAIKPECEKCGMTGECGNIYCSNHRKHVITVVKATLLRKARKYEKIL